MFLVGRSLYVEDDKTVVTAEALGLEQSIIAVIRISYSIIAITKVYIKSVQDALGDLILYLHPIFDTQDRFLRI